MLHPAHNWQFSCCTLIAQVSLLSLQAIVSRLSELQERTEEEHWGAVVFSRGMSTRRKVKSIILQLFAVRQALTHCLKDGGAEALFSAAARSGVKISEVGDIEDPAIRIEDRKKRRSKKINKDKDSMKVSKKGKHRSKHKGRRHHSDHDHSSKGDLMDALSSRQHQCHIELGPYFCDCSQDECVDCLFLLAACNRMGIWASEGYV